MAYNPQRTVFGSKPYRVYALTAVLALPVLAIVGRLVYVQVLKSGEYRARAVAQQSRKFEVPAKRGEIFVEDGGELSPVALNNSLKFLYVDPKLIKDPEAVAKKLAPVINQDEARLRDQLTLKASRYIELKQQIGHEESEKISKLQITGLILRDRDYRYYPESNLLSHVLGYVNSDGKGQYGVEQYLDEKLAGKNGSLKAVTDSNGVPISTQDNISQEPEDGIGAVLTIDRYIQGVAERALKSAIDTNNAPSGSVIVMDPKTGAIRAMVNYPDYDPNAYGKVSADNYNSFINSAVSNQFEPGSGFKPLTMAIGLETGKIRPDTTFNDTGSETIGEYTIRNAENHSFGMVDMSLVIKNSINTGMVFILKQLGGGQITRAGKEVLYQGIQKFGLGKKTGVDLAGEASGKLKDPKAADIDYANMTFGQGIGTTSLQMITALSAIANGGTLVKPYVVDKTIGTDGKITPIEHKPQVQQLIKKENANAVAQMMIKVVEGGSGYLTRIPGYKIAGKTGTAQVPRADGKGYETDKNIGSFIGFAPVDNPQFIILVRVDYPKTNTFAERSAVPAFAEIAKELFKYYNIPPS